MVAKLCPGVTYTIDLATAIRKGTTVVLGHSTLIDEYINEVRFILLFKNFLLEYYYIPGSTEWYRELNKIVKQTYTKNKKKFMVNIMTKKGWCDRKRLEVILGWW